MIGGIGGDHCDARQSGGAIRMDLHDGVPEIFGPVLLAHEEPALRRQGIARKGEREGYFDFGSVRLLCCAREIEGFEPANASFVERGLVRARILGGEHQHGKAFAFSEIVTHESAE